MAPSLNTRTHVSGTAVCPDSTRRTHAAAGHPVRTSPFGNESVALAGTSDSPYAPSLQRFPFALIGPPARGTCPCPTGLSARIPLPGTRHFRAPGFVRASERRETPGGAVPMLLAPQRRTPIARSSPGCVRRVRRLTLTAPVTTQVSARNPAPNASPSSQEPSTNRC